MTELLFWSGILGGSPHLWLFSEREGPLHHQKLSWDSSHCAAQYQPEADGFISTGKTHWIACWPEHGPGTLHVWTVITRQTVGSAAARKLPFQPHNRSEHHCYTLSFRIRRQYKDTAVLCSVLVLWADFLTPCFRTHFGGYTSRIDGALW